MPATIKALLMDLDGVLVDAMTLHEEAFLSAVRAYGGIELTVEQHRGELAGLPTKAKLKRLVETGALDHRKCEKIAEAKQALTQTYIEQRLRPDRHRAALLEHFQGAGFQLGCVTNCIRSTTEEMLKRATLHKYFDTCIITNEDVKAPKPDPEPYIRACQVLGRMPHEVVAFEDHDRGLTSAFQAGCYTRAIPQFKDLTVEVVWTAIQEANAQNRLEEKPDE